MTNNHAARTILDQMQLHIARMPQSGAWLPIADALLRLEELDEKTDAGRPWTDVLQNDLATGQSTGSVTLGHLNKIRRVGRFVRIAQAKMDEPFPDEMLIRAQFSALEVAERFHSLDPQMGISAFQDCIERRKSYATLRREYEDFAAQNLNRLSGKRATWASKRLNTGTDQEAEAQRVRKIFADDPKTFIGAAALDLELFTPEKLVSILRRTDHGLRVVTDDGKTELVGVEVSDLNFKRRELEELFQILEFQASFFNRYWVFARSDSKSLTDLHMILDDHHVTRIGLARLEERGAHILLHPSSAGGNPTRQADLSNLLESQRYRSR